MIMFKLIRLLIVLLICWAASACQSNESNIDPSKLQEIEQVWSTIPLYPGMVEVKRSSSAESGVWVDKDFKSDAAFDDVRRFYMERLTQAGWQFVREQEVKDRGRFKGERLVEFRKGFYQLDVQYSGERKAAVGWDYSIDITRVQ